jgi:TPR repeat protein
MNFNGKKTFLSVGIIILIITGITAVALLYFTGKGLTAKYLRAFLGDVQSQAELGDYYGYEIKRQDSALYWYKKAAKNGRIHEFAEYARNIINKKDPRGLEIYKEICLSGDFEACESIADSYKYPFNTPMSIYIKKSDPISMLWWYDKAIEQAEKFENKELLTSLLEKQAQFYLAFKAFYRNPEIPPDHKKALSYLERAEKISASYYGKGYVGYSILLDIGIIHLYGGYGVERDEKKGADYILKEKHKFLAARELAKLYFNGIVVPQDFEKVKKVTEFYPLKLLMLDDYDEKSEDNIFNFPKEPGNELYKCFLRIAFVAEQKEVAVSKNNDRYMLKYKVYQEKKLKSEVKKNLSAKEWAGVEDKINTIKFFELYSDNGLQSPDGHSYKVEGIKDGRFQLIYRYVNGTDIYPLCDYLFELAGQKLYKE